MSRNQRLGFLGIAAVIAVVAAVILLVDTGPSETAEDAADPASTQRTATPSATASAGGEEAPTPEPTATATPRPQPPLLTAGKVTRLRFQEGETVRFRVRHDAPDHVHVHGYDLMKDLVPGETVTISFKATITGIFEVELEDSGEQIAELRVDPR
jgi:FtsP/CotA-like multicopper oxidase with cupredoxin domain